MIFIFVVLVTLHVSCSKGIFDAVFWEVKPYAFTNSKGQIDGVYPMIFRQASIYCRNTTTLKKYNATELISFQPFNMSSRRDFLKAFASNYEAMPEMRPGLDVWFPVFFKNTDETQRIERRKQLMNFDISTSKELAIIVRRDYISLPYKIIRGIFSCGQIIFISILLTVLFGIALWLVEGKHNSAFPEGSIRGAGTGMWWSLVSMTTVGYGDVVPKTVLGRGLAIVWMFIGVMIACVITATVTEVVNGISDLKISNRRVAVLENSFESVKLRDFRAIAVELPTYNDVLKAVRDGTVYAAAINANIAAWNIDEIQDDSKRNPLRIAKKLHANLNLNIVLSMRIRFMPEIRDIIRCMERHKTEVYYRPVSHFALFCPTETIYMGSFVELFNTLIVQVLLSSIAFLFVVGVIKNMNVLEQFRTFLKQNKKGCDEENMVDGDMERMRYMFYKDRFSDGDHI